MTQKYQLTDNGKSKLETREQNLKRQIMHIAFLQSGASIEEFARVLDQRKRLVTKLVDELVAEGILQ